MRLVDQCPACESVRFRQRVAINDGNRDRFHRFSEQKFGGLLGGWIDELQPEIVACDDCGHHWYLRQPSPEQLLRMYASGRPLRPGTVSRQPTSDMIEEMQRLARMVGKKNPSLLDFGSGFGRWARAAARVGFRVHAYEPSVERGAELVDEFTRVHDQTELVGMKFDVINCEQVLEHVPAPIETLKVIGSYFSAEAILRVSVPNILRPPEGRQVWNEWPYGGERVHIMAPFEHLHGFTPKSLRLALECAGCEPVEVQRLIGCYPGNAMRRIAGRFVPRLGQTLALVKASRT